MRGEDAHHLARVLRGEPGQLYELSDGTNLWLAQIERATRDRVEFSVVEQLPTLEPRLATALLLSIVKFDRFEWALEKATELGVTAIVPLAAARSEKALVAAAVKRAARWKKILAESAQQSRRLRAPELFGVKPAVSAFRERFLAEDSTPSGKEAAMLRLLLSESRGTSSLKTIIEQDPESRRIVLAIGPEGGWTDAEREAALAGGFREASLGENILRSETAVAAALASLNYALDA